MPEPLVYLNGEFLPYADARIPVEDRGMQFADGVYEVVRYYLGRPFRMADHLARLVRSAEGIELPLPPLDLIEQAMNQLVERQGMSEATVYLQITRGPAPRLHGLIDHPTPTVIAIARPASTTRPRPTLRVVTASDDRWARCYLKTTMLLPNALARERARRLGADDAIFLRDGFVMEATSSNVFLVRQGRLLTSPLTNYILAGITRGVVLELAAQIGIPVSEEPIPAHWLYQADEVFLTGTNTELGPIISVDSRSVGTGQPGAIYQRLLEAFDALTRASQPLSVRSG
ncbi:MAG TPA: aminotransferase class IV [Chloroflexota bacterium]|jgi:D-alanine transaminase|nr:aminotransferase class IV [Chloroflexota bacterium]